MILNAVTHSCDVSVMWCIKPRSLVTCLNPSGSPAAGRDARGELITRFLPLICVLCHPKDYKSRTCGVTLDERWCPLRPEYSVVWIKRHTVTRPDTLPDPSSYGEELRAQNSWSRVTGESPHSSHVNKIGLDKEHRGTLVPMSVSGFTPSEPVTGMQMHQWSWAGCKK